MKIREKILVIEDEQTIRNFMQAVLTANDYDVLLARTGAMGESMIASHCPDVIILDLGLPDVDGMEILRKVRRWSKVPILVVSARTHERDKVEALDAGADDYLTKPFGTGELLARIRAAIRHTRTPAGSEAVANTGIFRAGGDTRFGLVCDTIDMWCYAVPLGFLAAFVLKLPVLWVYFLLCTDEFVKWPWVIRHYRSGAWLKNITRDGLFAAEK